MAATAIDGPRQGETMRQPRKRSAQVGVPRRFGIGTLMILTAAFAVLCSVLKVLGASPLAFVCVLGFVSCIAACQVLLFRGKNPRAASIVGGLTIGVLVGLSHVGWRAYQGMFLPWILRELALMGFWCGLAGAIWGYLAGLLVATIFLVRKEPDDDLSETGETMGSTRSRPDEEER
jgi:hypothetical protein